MKDSIKSSSIHNRKIVLEIRYEPNPMITDIKGQLIQTIKTEKIINPFNWKYGLADVMIKDNDVDDDAKNIIFFDTRRFSYIKSGNFTNASFYDNLMKILKPFNKIIGEDNVKIIRIGCRIQGTYSSEKKTYKEILNTFLQMFPQQFLYDKFESNDLLFNLNYENGRYSIGPVNANDQFLQENFRGSDRNNSIGFSIDTDNHVSITEGDTSNISQDKIKDVVMASLSVEKYLFESLNSL
jgi:hypothetical protein